MPSNRKLSVSANSSKQKKFKPTFKEVYIKQSVLSDKDKQAICFLMEHFGEWASTKTVLRAVHKLIDLLPKYKSLQEHNISLDRQLSDSTSKLETIKRNLDNIKTLRKSIEHEKELIFKSLNFKY